VAQVDGDLEGLIEDASLPFDVEVPQYEVDLVYEPGFFSSEWMNTFNNLLGFAGLDSYSSSRPG